MVDRLAHHALLACALFGLAVTNAGLIVLVLNVVAVILGAPL